jgi:hypothetical protein
LKEIGLDERRTEANFVLAAGRAVFETPGEQGYRVSALTALKRRKRPGEDWLLG